MREPLPFDSQNTGLGSEVVSAIHVLYMLELIEVEDFPRLQIPQLSHDQAGFQLLLGYGAYVDSINPLNPSLILGDGGDAHLVDVSRQLHLPESAIAQRRPEDLAGLRRAMMQRIRFIHSAPGRFTQECRIATESDVRFALGRGRIVSVRPKKQHAQVLLLPIENSECECWLFQPLTGYLEPTSTRWVAEDAAPMLSSYGTAPLP